MNAAEIAERYAGHPFVDYFDCLTASLEAARRRNKLAVRARLAGDEVSARRHQKEARDHMRLVRDFHDRINWSDDE